MPQQQATGGLAPATSPEPLWRGEYDRIYRLMTAAKLRTAAEERRSEATLAISPEGVP